ncbi:hypothetical protein SB775_33785, partial [Peribacillus sp. SIMBA_075]|uniref:hypothetical protein n=1 Tax=Peribacillus sp. SIMBA_075 TaxID=3085813 RepID=UPI00397CD728
PVMHPTHPLRHLALALVLAPLTAAAAAAADDARTLDTVQVTAPIAKDSGTATKTNTSILETPQSISVVTDRQMRDRGI